MVTLPTPRATEAPEADTLNRIVRELKHRYLPNVRAIAHVLSAIRALSVDTSHAGPDTTRGDVGRLADTLRIVRVLDQLAQIPYTPGEFRKVEADSVRNSDLAQADIDAALRRLERERIPLLTTGQIAARVANIQSIPAMPADVRAKLDTTVRLASTVIEFRDLEHRVLFILRSRHDAELFWKQTGGAPLNIGGLSSASSHGASYTELTSPLLHVFRASLNAVLSTSGGKAAQSSATAPTPNRAAALSPTGSADPTTPDTSAMERFLAGGGLVNLSLAYPVLHWDIFHDHGIETTWLVQPRVGGTLPAAGAASIDSTLLWDAGSELHINSFDATSGFGIFGQLRFATAGGNANFFQVLGVPADRQRGLRFHNWPSSGLQGFGYSTATFGCVVLKQAMITVTRIVAGPHSIQHLGWQLSVTAFRAATTPEPSTSKAASGQ